MDLISLQLQLLPKSLQDVPWFLASYGAIWPHTLELNEGDVAQLIDLRIARTIPVSTEQKLMTLLVAGSRLRQYLIAGTEVHRTPVAQHAIEMASSIDLALPFYRVDAEVRIDRRRRWIRAGDREDYYMVRLRPPTIRTLARNEDDDSVIIYVPPRHVKSLEQRAERAELYRANHHNLIIRPFDLNRWPPSEEHL